jgi:hypothetical protein
LDEPLVVLFDQEHAGEADECSVVGVDPDDVRAAADLFVDPLERVRGSELGPVLARKVIEGEQLVFGLFEQPGDLRRRCLQSVDDVGEPLAGLSPVSALKIWRIAVAIIGC